MKKNIKIILLAVTVLAAAMSSGYFLQEQTARPSLKFLCGAGMKAPVLEIVHAFEAETGIKVHVFFDGSAILSDFISTFRTGDLFLPSDAENLDTLQNQGLVAERSFVAWHIGAIFVSPGFKDKIRGVDDLAMAGLRIVLANPRQAGLGRVVMKKIIQQHPAGESILHNVAVYGSSSQEVLDLYKQGQADAMIEWDVMGLAPEAPPGLTMVPIEAPYQIKEPLPLGLLTTSGDPVLARRFYDYLLCRGREVFRRHGYNVEEGA